MQSQYSLKKRLIIYVSVFSIALGCLLIFSAYRIALQEINEVLDAQMQNLAERVAQHDPEPVQSQFDQARHYHEEDLFVDVWSYAREEHKTHAMNLLVRPVKKAGFYTHKTAQGVWHTYVLPLKNYQVQVSQQQSTRQHLALELAGSMFIPYLLFMPCVIWGLSWIISRSLQPLDDFKAELAQRDSEELSAIQSNAYPLEIVPTITEMNHLFERISSAQQEQRQFIADAAHELRTPITALNLQMQILLKQFPDAQELQNLSKGLIRIQHLVSQLLNLAKQDASILEVETKQNFSLNQVAVNCVEQLINLAMQKEIDLGMERQEDVLLYCQESAVHSIIFNLIDNAIKYTPNHGVINVSVFKQDGFAMIQVEDSGPGIASELYEKILKRFYRVHHHLEIGSGLGLSIVDKATERLGGKISFSKSASLGGLQVNVQLPL
ncbi:MULTISPECIES: sensor histidine kinase [unclassified Acinetobacter]|uniref:sensor histidine kinase n=1 Tax=unclassified Acinetobacter TaxID=196816 RepID=UPI001220884C|nr:MULTISPECIES: ATP-binding protein [unclassified Acinetobacter]RZJ23312.1 MAG: GHKL domain-containing protein [Acinetobacter sp.]